MNIKSKNKKSILKYYKENMLRKHLIIYITAITAQADAMFLKQSTFFSTNGFPPTKVANIFFKLNKMYTALMPDKTSIAKKHIKTVLLQEQKLLIRFLSSGTAITQTIPK